MQPALAFDRIALVATPCTGLAPQRPQACLICHAEFVVLFAGLAIESKIEAAASRSHPQHYQTLRVIRLSPPVVHEPAAPW